MTDAAFDPSRMAYDDAVVVFDSAARLLWREIQKDELCDMFECTERNRGICHCLDTYSALAAQAVDAKEDKEHDYTCPPLGPGEREQAFQELHGCMIRRPEDTCEVRKEFLAIALEALDAAIVMEARQGGDAQQAPSASAGDSAGPKDIAQ